MPVDDELVEGAPRPFDRLLAGSPRHDQLGQHRVERAADDVALDYAGVDADARTGRGEEPRHDARRGQEVASGVLAVDPELDRVRVWLRVVVAERLPVGDAELLADEVDAGDLLADRVLDLEAGVDLEEGDDAVLPDEELAGPGADIAGLGQDRLRCAEELRVLLFGEERRGRLLDELLVAALQRAVTRRHHDHGAVLVGQALGLDVAWLVEEPLDEALAAPEGGDRLAHGRLEQVGDLLDGPGDLEAAAATAVGRLDGHGEPVLLRERHHLVRSVDRVGRARYQGGARLESDVARLDLVAQRVDRVRARPDPGQPGVDDRLGEPGVLGEEPVAGVDRVGTGLRRDVEELVDDEVAVAGGRATEGVRLVRHLDVQRVPVGLGVDGDRADPGVPAGPGDADGDLAAVGDQHLRDRHGRSLTGACRAFRASRVTPAGRRGRPCRA